LVELPPPQVDVAKPLLRKIADQLEYTGNLQATDVVHVRARVSGYLKSIDFQDGETVEEGEQLFLIDPAPFEAARDSAEANLRKAEAALKFAEAELERTKPLVKRGALSAQELDVKDANVATAKADVDAAEAARKQAQLNLDYTKIAAPIGGRIGRHMVDVGNLVEAQSTILVTIERYEPIYAYFSVSESDMMLMRELPGEGVSSATEVRFQTRSDDAVMPPDRAAGLKVQLGLPGDEGYPYTGSLDFTQLGVDPSTGTQLRRATFENQDQQLVPGMFVRIRVPIGSQKERLLVPERAVGVDQTGEFVLVVNDESKVEKRPVKLGLSIGGMRVVDRGVEVVDRIVINGLQRARPGQAVTTTDKGSELPGAAASLIAPPVEADAAPRAEAAVARTTRGD
jgi:RND family efflux transporter MFP subunit